MKPGYERRTEAHHIVESVSVVRYTDEQVALVKWYFDLDGDPTSEQLELYFKNRKESG